MHLNQKQQNGSDNVNRDTVVGYFTQQHDELQQKIRELVVFYNLQLSKFIDLCADHPRIKEDYHLIHELFQRKDLVRDIIKFVFVPSQLMAKYSLKQEQARKYLDIIKQFIMDNSEFNQHLFLALHHRDLSLDVWFEFLDSNKEEPCSAALSNLNDVLIPIIKYQYSSSSRISQLFQNDPQEHLFLILNYFSPELIERLMAFTQHQAVFQVFFNLIIASLEEQQWRISLAILQKLFKSSITAQSPKQKTLQTHIESVYTMITQVSNNISKDKHNTIFAFTNAIYQSKFLSCCINSLHSIINEHLLGNLCFQLNEKVKETIEYNLKCISQIINIYYLLRKNGIDDKAEQMKKMEMSILHLFHQFPTLLPLLLSNQQKSLDMTNGENIRSVCLYKYQFFNLIKNSLQLIKDYGQNNHEFQLNVQKVQLLELSIKYLTEYRWNNILHCVLQKIISLTISKQIFKQKSNTIHKMLDQLIESFINKKFLFLTSMRMTNQGNLHLIYNVSCLISLVLQKAHTFYDIANPYVEWNSFMKTLEKYEERHKKYKQSQLITEEQIYQSQKNDKYGLKVEIDELVSIKQIIEKRQIYTKWRKKDKESSSKSQKDLNRISNSAKKYKSKDKLTYPQHSKQKYYRKSVQLHQHILSGHGLQKKLSSSDGFAKEIFKQTQNQTQLNQFSETKSDIDQKQIRQ